MSIVLLVITDGRLDYLDRAVKSAKTNLDGPIHRRIMFDDTGDDEHRTMLADRFPQFEHINGGKRQGFGGAIRAAWRHIATECRNARYVFHLEQDFTFNRPVDLRAMSQVLDANPHIAQFALRRQPWNQAEQDAGGIVEQHPNDYHEHHDKAGCYWLQHRRFWTTNPSLYRRGLTTREWPTGPNSEGHFSIALFDDPEVVAAYWGARDSGEWVRHIGNDRVGIGY